MPELDVYREWLGIKEPERPLSHYQLLRLGKFEDDAGKVRANYRKMNSHVRKYSAGEFSAQSQSLLNELAKAMLCLTDTRRKAEYDASLGRADAGGARRSLEQILIGRKVVDPAQLTKARNYASTVGVEVRDALVQQKLAPADVVMQAYAESLGLPYIDLEDIGIDAELVPRVPAVLARQHSFAPVMADEGTLLMASPNPLPPEVEEELRLRLGMPVRTVICTPGKINEAIGKHYPKEAAIAQMVAAKGGPVISAPAAVKPSAATAAAAPATAPAPAKAAAPTEAGQKKKKMLAIVSFNFTFLAVAAVVYLTNLVLPPPPKFFLSLGIAAGVAAIVAATVYMVAPARE